MVDITIRIWHK